MKRPWSLKNRMTTWVAVVTISLVSLIGITATSFVLGATTREFDGLVREESDELLAIFRDRDLSKEAMAQEAEEMGAAHPEVGIAWRLWNPKTSEVWGEFGHPGLLPSVGSVPTDRWLRWQEVEFSVHRGADLDNPLYLGLLVDGRGRLLALKRYGTIAGGILLSAALIAMLGGRMLAGRTARQLARIASGIDASSKPGIGDLLSGENPPVEIQQVADSLTDALAKARKEQERNSLLIAGIAHELRSPIQNLLGETEVSLMRDRSPEEYRAILESHSDEIQDLAREIDNLVTLCAHASNQEAESREKFDLGHEIELRLPRELIRAKRHGIDIKVQVDGDLAMTGDREALLLMVRNLVGNAVSYSPANGVVHVSATGQNGEVLLCVEDQGPGVLPENRSRIFEPFQRGQDRPGTRAGFGLGLALSQEAVTAQGGKLTVSDSVHGGARFEARLPNRVTSPPESGADVG